MNKTGHCQIWILRRGPKSKKKLKRDKEKMKCKFLIFDILLKISAIFGSGIFVHGFFSWYTFPIRLKDLEIIIMICF